MTTVTATLWRSSVFPYSPSACPTLLILLKHDKAQPRGQAWGWCSVSNMVSSHVQSGNIPKTVVYFHVLSYRTVLLQSLSGRVIVLKSIIITQSLFIQPPSHKANKSHMLLNSKTYQKSAISQIPEHKYSVHLSSHRGCVNSQVKLLHRLWHSLVILLHVLLTYGLNNQPQVCI